MQPLVTGPSNASALAIKTEPYNTSVTHPESALLVATGSTFLDTPAKMLPELDRKAYPNIQYWSQKSWLKAVKNGTVIAPQNDVDYSSDSDSDSGIGEDSSAIANVFLETQDGLYVGKNQ